MDFNECQREGAMNDIIHIDCDCISPEHILRFTWDPEDKLVYTEIQLVQWRNIWKRIWVAIRYVFGHQCAYGTWDCTIMGRPAMVKLHKYLGDKLRKSKLPQVAKRPGLVK
jgi:hypothetical protein